MNSEKKWNRKSEIWNNNSIFGFNRIDWL